MSEPEETKEYIEQLMRDGRLHSFYLSAKWIHLKNEVLEENHNECLRCKQEGKYKKAEVVHHVRHVRDNPAYALSKTVTINGRESVNLIPLCKRCHEIVHGYRFRGEEPKEPITKERW